MSGKARKLPAAPMRVSTESVGLPRTWRKPARRLWPRVSAAACADGGGTSIRASATITARNEIAFTAKQAPVPAARQQEARDHGADRAREVELERVQRDRVGDLRRRHHRREHRLVGGRRLRLGQPGEEGRDEDGHEPRRPVA